MYYIETLLIVLVILGGLGVYLLLIEVHKKMLTGAAVRDRSPIPRRILKGYVRAFVTGDNFFVTSLALFLAVFVVFLRHGQFLLDVF